jgi:hypothetical protein
VANYPFDFNTSKVRKDGTRSQENPYTLHIVQGQQVLERPPGSGHFFNADGSPMDPEDVPGQVAPKLRVPAKDQGALVGPAQTVSIKEGSVTSVKEVDAPKDVLSDGKKSEDKRK